MAEATITEIRQGQPSRLETLEDQTLLHWMTLAKNYVIRDGVEIANEYFKDLHIIKTYDFLESTGLIPNEVTQEAVGDVSIAYDTNIPNPQVVFYRERYDFIINQVRGFEYRFC